jgi:Putative zincin peptidase
MIFIPGELIALLTFPGVIIHEAAHMLFCKWGRVAVLDMCFYRWGNPAGYVIHEEPRSFHTAFLISVGPFIVNSLVCILFCFPAFVPMRIFHVQDPISVLLSYFLLWLGLSIGMHAFPSTADANVLWKQARKAAANYNPLAILSFPLVAIIYVANFGRMFWLDLMYGIAIGLGLPELVLKNLV